MRFLLPLKGSIQKPCFAPNSNELLITHYADGYSQGASGLFKISLHDRNKMQPIHDEWLKGHAVGGATWHKSGIVFTTDAFGCFWPYRMDADGKNLVALSRPDRRHFGLCPTLSPDGEWFAFERYRTNDFEVGSIVLGQVGDDESLTVISDAEDSCHPVWSPDGQWIVWQARSDATRWDWQLRLYDVQERRMSNIALGDSGLSQPAWQPDSGGLIATGDDGLYTVSPGDEQARLRTPTNPPRIRWLGNGTWSKDAKRVVCEASADEGGPEGPTWLEIF